MLKHTLRYGDWHITYDRTILPSVDYSFFHDSYDGAPDSDDHRCGSGSSVDDCIDQIHDMEEEINYART